jgi:hypothetical protein
MNYRFFSLSQYLYDICNEENDSLKYFVPKGLYNHGFYCFYQYVTPMVSVPLGTKCW